MRRLGFGLMCACFGVFSTACGLIETVEVNEADAWMVGVDDLGLLGDMAGATHDQDLSSSLPPDLPVTSVDMGDLSGLADLPDLAADMGPMEVTLLDEPDPAPGADVSQEMSFYGVSCELVPEGFRFDHLVTPGDDLNEVVKQAAPGATIGISAGLHRITQPLEMKTGQRLIGAGREGACGAVISGAAVLAAADIQDEGNGLWSFTRPRIAEQRGAAASMCGGSTTSCAACQPERPACYHTIGVFDGEQVLQPVEARAQLVPGTFWMEPVSAADGSLLTRFWVQRAADTVTPPALEVSDHVDRGVEGSTAGARDVALINLKFTRFMTHGVDVGRNQGWLIRRCEFSQNGYLGVALGPQSTLTRSRSCDNGNQGVYGEGALGQSASPDIVLAYNHTCRNNSRGYKRSDRAGGMKFKDTRGALIRDNWSVDDDGYGLVLDGVSRTTVEHNLIERSAGYGILVNGCASPEDDPNLIVRNTIHDAKDYGLFFAESSGLVGTSNIIERCRVGIVLRDTGSAAALNHVKISGNTVRQHFTSEMQGPLWNAATLININSSKSLSSEERRKDLVARQILWRENEYLLDPEAMFSCTITESCNLGAWKALVDDSLSTCEALDGGSLPAGCAMP